MTIDTNNVENYINAMKLGDLRSLIRYMKKEFDQYFNGLTGTAIVKLNTGDCRSLLLGEAVDALHLVAACNQMAEQEAPKEPKNSPGIREGFEEGGRFDIDEEDVEPQSPLDGKIVEMPSPEMKEQVEKGYITPNPIPENPLARAIADVVAPLIESNVSQDQFDEMVAVSETLQERLAAFEGNQVKQIEIVHKREGEQDEVKPIGKQHKCFEKLLRRVRAGLHCYLPGPAGSGKTTAAENVAKALDLECSAKSVCAQTSEVAFLGYMDATGNYVSTEFRNRYENGGIFILDEIDNGNPNVLAVLNSALANGSCSFADGMVKKHDDFILIATANTVGSGANAQYVGRNAIDGATLDRFAFIDWPYDEQLETGIAMTIAGAEGERIAKRVQSYRASATELNSRVIISPRATFQTCTMTVECGEDETVEDIEASCIWRGTPQDEILKIKKGAVKA